MKIVKRRNPTEHVTQITIDDGFKEEPLELSISWREKTVKSKCWGKCWKLLEEEIG